jgi:hypothetical protein
MQKSTYEKIKLVERKNLVNIKGEYYSGLEAVT